MIIKVGFNTDFGKDKFDVGLDEVDLARILAEAGIPPDAQLTSLDAFRILHTEAERFCAAKRIVVVPSEAEGCKLEVRRLTGLQKAQLDDLKQRFSVE